MRIIITGGGTGGHVSPAVAVITRLRERSVQEARPLNLLYIGSEAGVERRVMSELGVPYAAIQTGKLRRNTFRPVFTPLQTASVAAFEYNLARSLSQRISQLLGLILAAHEIQHNRGAMKRQDANHGCSESATGEPPPADQPARS